MYTVYKTTNLANGKYYFGVHKTDNPIDDYLGSGTYIIRAIAKYGREKFRKDVLFIFDETNAASAFAKEDELIQCYRGRDPLCMNLRRGGDGGFDWINKNGLHPAKLDADKVKEMRRLAIEDNKFAKELSKLFGVAVGTVTEILRGTNPSWKKVTRGVPVVPVHRCPKRGNYTPDHRAKLSQTKVAWWEVQNESARSALSNRMENYWVSRPKSAEHGRKIGEGNRRRRNPITGRKWMNDASVSRLVKPEEVASLILQGWKGGRL
jgi:hypothetical protein